MADDRVAALAARVHRGVTEKSYLEDQLANLRAAQASAKQSQQDADLAKQVVLEVAQKTQANIGGRISDLVSLALAAVFDDPYRLRIDFVQRRGVTEADLFFARGDHLADPMTACGGGTIDIASFALRLAVWTLSRSRPLFILDEPFRNLSLDRQAKAGLMLQQLSRRLGLQIVMVSHNPEIISGADKVFRLDRGMLCCEEG